ncbi:hypothetical protein N658DRAFT_322923 [Parathielavia hyrcaniae]|uniref:Uncharacterized protein n=1 Tax=Parathielavia hyrcaniae TaxID=113614 RepID=A0AAN6Q390_9PEZI|nr:hypothetical protein N658DRAFT_322923 [Parathielavia hyrcaniae]
MGRDRLRRFSPTHHQQNAGLSQSLMGLGLAPKAALSTLPVQKRTVVPMPEMGSWNRFAPLRALMLQSRSWLSAFYEATQNRASHSCIHPKRGLAPDTGIPGLCALGYLHDFIGNPSRAGAELRERRVSRAWDAKSYVQQAGKGEQSRIIEGQQRQS